MGMAGGIMLLVIIASLTETIYIVPLYSSVQLISNTTRLLLFFKHIHWDVLVVLGAAVILGTFLGKKILTKIPDRYFLIAFKAILAIIALRIIVIQVWLISAN